MMGRSSKFLSGERPNSMPVTPTGRGAAAFEIVVKEVCEVAPLPKQVREKWSDWENSREVGRYASLEDITARLERARRKREDFRRWLMRRQSRSSPMKPSHEELRAVRAKKLEEKMAIAEQKRQSTLEAVRLKAAAMHQRTEEVVERLNERQELLAQKLLETLQAAETRRQALQEAEKERLNAAHELVLLRLAQIQKKEEKERESCREELVAKLVQADAAREARLAAASAKAGSKVRHAKHVSKMRRLNEERDTEMKRNYLDSKLQTAADRRREDFTVRMAVNAEKSETQFLKRQATKREKLRRQGSSRRLQHFWRSFKNRHCTTHELARDLVGTGVTFFGNVESDYEDAKDNDDEQEEEFEHIVMIGGMRQKPKWRDTFEDFASRLQSQGTITAAKKLLKRLETRLSVKGGSTHECSALLRRLFPKTAKSKLERYPTRVFLCAYMILNHPEVVFNRKGQREAHLSAAAKEMIVVFEKLLQRILVPFPGGGGYSSGNESSGTYEPLHTARSTDWDLKAAGETGSGSECRSIGELLLEFDAHYVSYLEQFVAWKSHDAAGLEAELVRMAVELEASMLRKCKGDINSPRVQSNSDLKAVVEQVAHDHKLLAERIQRLSGKGGVERLQSALVEVRERVLAEQGSTTETEDSATDSDSYNGTSRRNPRVSRGGNSSRAANSQGGNGSGSGIPLPGVGKKRSYGNEELVWELLYDRNWHFPTEDVYEEWNAATGDGEGGIPELSMDASGMSVAQVGEMVEKNIRKIAEKAFWDSVEWKLTSASEGAGEELLDLLAQIGRDLKDVLPRGSSADTVAEIFDRTELSRLMSGSGSDALGGVDINGLLQLIEHTSALLREYGAPAREETAVRGHQSVRTQIMASLQKSGSEKLAALAKAVARALRVLHAQLKVLRLDASNARLRMLAQSLNGTTAVEYMQDKFVKAHELGADSDLSSKLSKTIDWLHGAAEHQSGLESVISGLGPVSQPTGVPVNLRSGLRASGSPTVPLQSEQWVDTKPECPVGTQSWKGAVRIALAQLISGETAAVSENLPETLQWDASRIHSVQDTFQKLLVMCAGMLILRETLQLEGRVLTPQEMAVAKGRLSVVLSDPQMKLSALTTELARLAGSPDEATETRMQRALMNLIVNRENGGFKALSAGLGKAIQILMLMGGNDDANVSNAVQHALARVGAAFLLDDVVLLAKDLGKIAGVNEAVHKGLYELIYQMS